MQFTVEVSNQTSDIFWVWAMAAYMNMEVRKGPKLLFGIGKRIHVLIG